MNMKRADWNSTLQYYTNSYKRFPGGIKGIDWGTQNSQKVRFAVLLDVMKERSTTDTILDIGCGYGDLSKFINWTDKYSGIDFNDLMIKEAKKRFPKTHFYLGNFIDESNTFDWVLSSGTFNVKTHDNEKLLQNSIRKMWELCRKGLAFNILIKGSHIRNHNMYFYNVGAVLNYCRTLTHSVVCRIDYLPHDASYYLYK